MVDVSVVDFYARSGGTRMGNRGAVLDPDSAATSQPNDPDPSRTATPYLMVLTLGSPAYFFARFGPGMALADAYLINGGDHSPKTTPD